MAKNSGVPSIAIHRTSRSAPRAYETNDRSISATPPPCAVELTFHTTRPANSRRARSSVSSNSRQASASSSSSKRPGENGGALTSLGVSVMRSGYPLWLDACQLVGVGQRDPNRAEANGDVGGRVSTRLDLVCLLVVLGVDPAHRVGGRLAHPHGAEARRDVGGGPTLHLDRRRNLVRGGVDARHGPVVCVRDPNAALADRDIRRVGPDLD